jgi:DnaK suppressor protein
MTPVLSHVPSGSPSPTTQELAELRRALEVCRREREQQLAALAMIPVGPDVDFVALAHTESAREILASVESALARMDAGTYGCVHCSALIPIPRLELVPYTDGCVTCRQRLTEGR